MKILTWNINGIRAAKISLGKLFESLDADVICLQETKITRDQLDEVSCIVEGYNSYFSFSKVRSGYSGVATFVRHSATPARAEEGLSGFLTTSATLDYVGCYGDQSEFDDTDLQALDNEGRAVITQHNVRDENGKEDYLTVINVYCPRADPEREDRKLFKLQFYKLLQERAEAILKEGSHVIILGDVNTSHKRIDNCDPGEDFEDHPGRKWLNGLLWQPEAPAEPADDQSFNSSTESLSLKGGHKFVDAFRYFHPDRIGAYTCWSTVTGARATNYGTRIDYIFGDRDLVTQAFSDCEVMQDVEGSDHCPVKAMLKWSFIPATKCPSLCTKYMPEFVGTQKKLSSFFTKVSKNIEGQLASSQESEDSGIGAFKGDSLEVGTGQVMVTDHSDTGRSTTVSSSAKQSITEPCQLQTSLKRSKSDTNQSSKRLKTSDKKVSVRKQGSLLNFFGKPQENNHQTSSVKVEAFALSSNNSTSDNSSEDITAASSSAIGDQPKASNDDCKGGACKKEVVSSWKLLLKGPPTAPLCKGHSEPCLLRTVKKEDSLNKGRQFWVCNRPEGHKTNVEARCDTFIWVDKKKK